MVILRCFARSLFVFVLALAAFITQCQCLVHLMGQALLHTMGNHTGYTSFFAGAKATHHS